MFQITQATRDDTYRMIVSINQQLDPPLPDRYLEQQFRRCWGDFQELLASLPPDAPSHAFRRFTREEILSGRWVKVGDHGFAFLLEFRPDGTVEERDLNYPDKSWSGRWRLLDDGELAVQFTTDAEYVLRVTAASGAQLHQGLEYNSVGGRNSYYMLHAVWSALEVEPQAAIPVPAAPQTNQRAAMTGTPIAYGSVVTLRHQATCHYLRSDLVTYTSNASSGQQRVTSSAVLDANCRWLVKEPHGAAMSSAGYWSVGDRAIVRLEHVATRTNLHTHRGFRSPATDQQEVSAFGTRGIGNADDNWQVELEHQGQEEWCYGDRIKLVHVSTGNALHSRAIMVGETSDQQEVTAFDARDDNDWWVVE